MVKELGLPINSTPSDYRSVHTALLTGLLSHIGQKDADKQEFTGARNARFSIFPGSGLFRSRRSGPWWPNWWKPAACGGASPRALNRNGLSRWLSTGETQLQRAALVEIAGAVMASEKVTLFGLPIVAARRVNYGSIDPLLCRELFIRHALVEGDWQTRHAFFRENQKLRAEVEELEHKSRRRDILVDDETLFGFYDRRIPNDVVSGRHFDSWWKSAAKQQPDLLNFEKRC